MHVHLLLRGCAFLLSLVALGPATACALAPAPTGERPVVTSPAVKTSYREMPVRLCVPVEAATWAALRSGATRLILHLQDEKPSYIYSPSFQVALVGSEKAPRVELEALSMHPDILLPKSDRPDAQHFAVDLRPHLPAALDRSTLCVEVGLEAKEAREDGRALRLWATLEPHDR